VVEKTGKLWDYLIFFHSHYLNFTQADFTRISPRSCYGFFFTSIGVNASVFGRPYIKRFALCYRPLSVLSCLSVCDVGVLWPKGWMDQHATLCGGRPRLRRHCVRWRPSSSSPKRYTAPNFRPISIVAKRSPISATDELLL